MEGITDHVPSGSRFSQGRSPYSAEPQAKVTLNICSRCARYCCISSVSLLPKYYQLKNHCSCFSNIEAIIIVLLEQILSCTWIFRFRLSARKCYLHVANSLQYNTSHLVPSSKLNLSYWPKLSWQFSSPLPDLVAATFSMESTTM